MSPSRAGDTDLWAPSALSHCDVVDALVDWRTTTAGSRVHTVVIVGGDTGELCDDIVTTALVPRAVWLPGEVTDARASEALRLLQAETAEPHVTSQGTVGQGEPRHGDDDPERSRVVDSPVVVTVRLIDCVCGCTAVRPCLR